MRREFKDGYLQPPYIRHNNNNRRDDITFCSWNVNGVNEPVKRGKVLTHLKSLQADVIFLQETHLKNDSYTRLRCRGIQHIYHSNFSVKARGTAILIRRGVPFKHLSTIADKDGRYVMVAGEFHSTPVTLLNILSRPQDTGHKCRVGSESRLFIK